jgi:hypothetical protein
MILEINRHQRSTKKTVSAIPLSPALGHHPSEALDDLPERAANDLGK